MQLNLIDINSSLVSAWTDAFAEFPEVNIREGDILKVAEDCVVSPANSYGYMDGGIDAVYCAFLV